MAIDLIRSRGQHRWTWRDRITTLAREVTGQFWIVALFWGLVVAGSGFVAGFVWGQVAA